MNPDWRKGVPCRVPIPRIMSQKSNFTWNIVRYYMYVQVLTLHFRKRVFMYTWKRCVCSRDLMGWTLWLIEYNWCVTNPAQFPMHLRQFCYLLISSSYFLCKVKLGKIKRNKSTQFLKMNYVFSETWRGIDRYYTGYRSLNQHVCLHHRHMTIDFPHYNKIYPLPFLNFFILRKIKGIRNISLSIVRWSNMVGMIESNIARKALW